MSNQTDDHTNLSASNQSPRVLYLGGLGRSGSTLLERLIGEAQGAWALGETVHLWQRGLRDNERCGCGAAFDTCPFWIQVGQIAYGGWDQLDVREILALKFRVDRSRYLPQLVSEKMSSRRHRDLADYVHLYRLLYRAAAVVSGAELVVDSSKHVSLMACLATAKDLDVRLVHVVRDSPGVAHSWAKRVSRPEADDEMARWSPMRSSFEWNVTNGMFGVLQRYGVNTLLVRYEDLVADPAAVVQRVLEHGGCSDVQTTVDELFIEGRVVELSGNHTVAGNPMRFKVGPIEIRQDQAWKHGMTNRDLALVRTMTLPLRRHLGYLGQDDERPPIVEQKVDPLNTQEGDPNASGEFPPVTVVVATRDRPDLLRVTLEAIRNQDYVGVVSTIVVYDQSETDESLASDDPQRPVSVISNGRSAGLAGARNAGIEAADTELLAFCDDDDSWMPAKTRVQVQRMLEVPEAALVSCGIRVHYGDHTVDRVLDQNEVSFEDLLRSRLTEMHPSGFLFRRSLITQVGLVDEEIPGSYAEDYEFLLRIARRHRILIVDQPLVDVLWHKNSFFTARWKMISTALTWLLAEYPEFDNEPRGKARITGQIAFANAAAGSRSEAWTNARETLGLSAVEPRAYLALLTASGLVGADRILSTLHRFGRGI